MHKVEAGEAEGVDAQNLIATVHSMRQSVEALQGCG